MEEESYYDLPVRSEQSASLYEHCKRASRAWLCDSANTGLPLMGTGDWNDGMNLVGFRGKGESVWLAFFLYDVLVQFASVAARRGDTLFVERCEAAAPSLKQNIEQHGWDGLLVPPRLLRRWNAARLGDQFRMPDRFHRAELVGVVRRRRQVSARDWPWKRWTSIWFGATRR